MCLVEVYIEVSHKSGLANSCTKPTIQVSADSFLETVPPVCLPSPEIDNVEEARTEDFRHDEVSDPLSMVHCISEFPELYESVVNISEVHMSDMLSTSLPEFPSSKTIEVGVQASESVLPRSLRISLPASLRNHFLNLQGIRFPQSIREHLPLHWNS